MPEVEGSNCGGTVEQWSVQSPVPPMPAREWKQKSWRVA